jgi:hypothetical protein
MLGMICLSASRLLLQRLVPFEGEDESPFVGLLRVEAAA